MKRIFIATIIVFALHSHMSFGSISTCISGLGQSIENVENVPVIGKLTNILPVAAFAACLKQCPLQTMMLLTALGLYFLSYNEKVQEMMDQYGIADKIPWLKEDAVTDAQQDIDEDIFVFDKEEEEKEVEDELPNNLSENTENAFIGDTLEDAQESKGKNIRQAFL